MEKYRADPEAEKEKARRWKRENPEKNKAITQQWNARNQEHLKEYRKRYYQENAELQKARAQEWRSANTERYRQTAREWRKKYPEKASALKRIGHAKRRTAKTNATPQWADHQKIRAIYEEAARLSVASGTEYHVDHIVPLLNSVVCGLHWEGNLQILPAMENQKKSNRFKI
jgi:hypothetical protein